MSIMDGHGRSDAPLKRTREPSVASSGSVSSTRPSPRIRALAERFESRNDALDPPSKLKDGRKGPSSTTPSTRSRRNDGALAISCSPTSTPEIRKSGTPSMQAQTTSPTPSFASTMTAVEYNNSPKFKSSKPAPDEGNTRIDGIPSTAKAEARELQDLLRSKSNDHIEPFESEPVTCCSEYDTEVQPAPHSSSMEPGVAVQASKIFAPNALPLYLPKLDDFLAKDARFKLPCFSDPRSLCSKEEAHLYRYNEPDGLQCPKMEVAGSQLAVPDPQESRPSLRRRRKFALPREDDVERRQNNVHLLLQDARSTDDHRSSSDETEEDGHLEKITSVLPQSQGLPSKTSTHEHPQTRLNMFPPLMLLRDNSLDELKSNAVGPRKAPGGFLGGLPGIGHVLGTIIDFLIGVEGSTFAAGIFRLQLFTDFVQMMDLNMHFVNATSMHTSASKLKKFSSFISFNYVSVFGFAIVILFSMMAIVAALLVAFWHLTRTYNPNRTLEGYASQPWLFRLISRTKAKGQDGIPQLQKSTAWSKAGHVVLIMILTILYMPLSKLCMDALVWNIDYWPDVTAPGLDQTDAATMTTKFCYRTNIDDSAFNWAYIVVPCAATTLLAYTLWFPWQMRRMIKHYIPRIAANNELGQKRTKQMLDTEYVRELDRDRAPFNFMYNAYRRRYGDYKPLYLLCFKLTTLLVISVVTQQNCIFQSFSQQKMLIAQQSVLIGLQSILLVAHLLTQPFVDMVSNRSELVSRIGYMATSILGLVTVLTGRRRTKAETAALFTVEGITYGFNIYLSLIGMAWMSHLIKRAQRRIDFSIDVFSPFLHLEKHIKRRVWQETLSTVLLCGREYRMPQGKGVMFSLDDGWPPYLVLFRNSAAERHVENLKILKYIGIEEYKHHAAQLEKTDHEAKRVREMLSRIQLDFTGADAYWQPVLQDGQTKPIAMEGVTSYFGKAFFVPFPPTLVMRYDQTAHGLFGKSTVQLTTPAEFEEYLRQNSCDDVQSRRWVRHALRALDGQPVFCPYVQHTRQGQNSSLLSRMRLASSDKGYHTLAKPIFYEQGTLCVRRRISSGLTEVPDRDAGFDVYITYTAGHRRDADGVTVVKEGLTVDASAAFGLRFDFAYTDRVRAFIDTNSATIRIRMPQIQAQAQEVRSLLHREAHLKSAKLSYAFLPNIFDDPVRSIAEVEQLFRETSSCREVRQLPRLYPATIRLLIERIDHITQSRIHQWWYLFWDDLWRQNNADFACLRRHRTTFNPMYPGSIAYTPMPRASLVTLLQSKRGIWIRDTPHQRSKLKQSTKGFQDRGLFDVGLVNRIYFVLDEIAFETTSSCSKSKTQVRGDDIRLGARDADGEVLPQRIGDIEMAGHSSECRRPSADDAPGSQHTGGGTNENDTNIIERGAWGWTEQRLAGRRVHSAWRFARERILEWLSIQPYKLNDNIAPLYIYLRRVDGHYETALPPPRPPSTVLHDDESSARPRH